MSSATRRSCGPETWQRLAMPSEAPRLLVGDIMAADAVPAHAVAGLERRTRAILQVQQGCDHRCTFCIIPFGRGPSRSVPLPEIVAQARALAASGYVEFVVTGVDIASYGRDLPGQPTLGAMLASLLAEVPELRRLRLSSLDPAAIDAELCRLVAEEPRLMPHLHLSVQAGHDLILKRMKRRHGAVRRDRAHATPAPAAAGSRLRRRPDRGLPDRGRGDVPGHARPGRGGRPDLPARISVTRPGPARRPRACRRWLAETRKERAARLRAPGAAALDAFPARPARPAPRAR